MAAMFFPHQIFGGMKFGDMARKSPIRQLKIPAKVSGYTVHMFLGCYSGILSSMASYIVQTLNYCLCTYIHTYYVYTHVLKYVYVYCMYIMRTYVL